MKIGISLGMLRPSLWAELTREADKLGYESAWMPEHLVIPVARAGSPHAGADHPPIPPDVPVFVVFAYLSFLAGQTEQIHFGTQVYNIGLRHPFIVARAVATLDVVSNGRLEFGIGAGWVEAEWEAVGLDFASRGRRVDESIEVCRRLWSGEVVEHHGEFFDFGPVMFEPKPTHAPCPPLHIGGDGPAALRRAAQVGGGWIPMNHTLEQIPAAATRIAQLARGGGTFGGRRDHPGRRRDRARRTQALCRRRRGPGVGQAVAAGQRSPRRHPALRRTGSAGHPRPSPWPRRRRDGHGDTGGGPPWRVIRSSWSRSRARIATLTLNRPEARNALNRALMYALWDAVGAAGGDPGVDAVILTGSDPAFCAGVDLKEVTGAVPPSAEPRPPGQGPERDTNGLFRFLPVIEKPVIGAINGPAATGGFEIALQRTFLGGVGTGALRQHPRAGGDHAGRRDDRVHGPVDGGSARAIEASLTGNFLAADEALRYGLVNHVVVHDDLLPFTRCLAADIVDNDQQSIRRLLQRYRQMGNAAALEEAHLIEGHMAETWPLRTDQVTERQGAT